MCLGCRIEAGGARELGVIDVLVQMVRRHVGTGNHGDARLGQMTLDRMTGEGSRPFEANVVDGVRVRYVKIPVTGLVAILNRVVPTCA